MRPMSDWLLGGTSTLEVIEGDYDSPQRRRFVRSHQQLVSLIKTQTCPH